MFQIGKEFSYYKREGDSIWYIDRNGGGLYQKNIITGKEIFIYMPSCDGIIANGSCTYNYLLIDYDEIWLIPRYARNIVVWNRKNNKEVTINFPEKPREIGEYFIYSFQTEEYVILIPASYQGILYVEKETKKVTIDNCFFEEYKRIMDERGIEDNLFIFRSNILARNETLYIPFYKIDKVLKYNYITKEYSLLDTIKEANGIERCVDKELELLIINRMNCVQADRSIDLELLKKAGTDPLLKVFPYYKYIFYFTTNKLFVFDRELNEYITADWIDKINMIYQQRLYVIEKDFCDDVLYVFLENNLFNITFRDEDRQVIVIIDNNEVKQFEYKLDQMSCEEMLIGAIQSPKCSAYNNVDSSVGKIIYQKMIECVH